MDPEAVLERCPRCAGPVQLGFVAGDRGLFWDTETRKVGFPAEMLTRKRLSTFEWFPAARCRQCKLVTFRHEVSQVWQGALRGYKEA